MLLALLLDLRGLELEGQMRALEADVRPLRVALVSVADEPDRKVFEAALSRLGLGNDLRQAVFVTDNAAHLEAAAKLGIAALRFGPGGDIESWASAPAIIADLIAQSSEAAKFHGMLHDNEQVAPPGEPLGAGQTHSEPIGGGPPTRKRFSAR